MHAGAAAVTAAEATTYWARAFFDELGVGALCGAFEVKSILVRESVLCGAKSLEANVTCVLRSPEYIHPHFFCSIFVTFTFTIDHLHEELNEII